MLTNSPCVCVCAHACTLTHGIPEMKTQPHPNRSVARGRLLRSIQTNIILHESLTFDHVSFFSIVWDAKINPKMEVHSEQPLIKTTKEGVVMLWAHQPRLWQPYQTSSTREAWRRTWAGAAGQFKLHVRFAVPGSRCFSTSFQQLPWQSSMQSYSWLSPKQHQ